MENIQPEGERPQDSAAGYGPRPVNPYILPASIVFAALIISGSLIYLVVNGTGNGNNNGNGTAAVLENPVVPEAAALVERDVPLGDPDAPLLVVEYGDYQCAFCGIFFTDVEPEIKTRYVDTGQARFVFRNLAFLGEESIAAAAAAECAKDQGMFWEYHDALFQEEVRDFAEARQREESASNNGNLNRALFLGIAGQLDMDTAAFTECIDSDRHVATVQEDNEAASAIGVNSTPSTFVNGRMVVVLDAEGNPVPSPQTGGLQGVGANGQPIMQAIEEVLQTSGN